MLREVVGSSSTSKIRIVKLRQRPRFVNDCGGQWLTDGYSARRNRKNNLKLSVFLNRCHTKGFFAMGGNSIAPQGELFLRQIISFYRFGLRHRAARQALAPPRLPTDTPAPGSRRGQIGERGWCSSPCFTA